MHIAFVACNKNPSRFMEDASFLYRCQNPALALREAGHKVTLAHLSRLNTHQSFDLIVVHRPRSTWGLRWKLRQLRRKSRAMLADIDDLIIDEAYASCSPAVLNGLLSEDAMRKQFQANKAALALFDAFSVSTEPLKARLAELLPGRTIRVLPNCVHFNWLKMAEAPIADSNHLRLTYFPGTRSHERDFQSIEPVIAEFLSQQPEVELEITGHLQTSIKARPGQVIREDKLPFDEYTRRVQQSWVNLCPLESTPFNDCKSALKVIEAGFWQRPTLASPVADTERFADKVAILCHQPDDWLTHLNTLLDAEEYRRRAVFTRQQTLAIADIRQHALTLLEFTAP